MGRIIRSGVVLMMLWAYFCALVVVILITACSGPTSISDATSEPTPDQISTNTLPPFLMPEPTSTPSSELNTPPPTLNVIANDPVLPILEPAGPGGMGALMSGDLVVVDRCLYLVSEFGVNWLPVFPADSASWERDTLVLRGQRFGIGEPVSVGGGEAGNFRNLRFLQEPHDSCDVRNVWIVYLGELVGPTSQPKPTAR